MMDTLDMDRSLPLDRPLVAARPDRAARAAPPSRSSRGKRVGPSRVVQSKSGWVLSTIQRLGSARIRADSRLPRTLSNTQPPNVASGRHAAVARIRSQLG
jgi:hypothetical protein